MAWFAQFNDFFCPISRLGSDNYNPYLSAERQMAELFDDRPKRNPFVKDQKSNSTATSPTSTSTTTNQQTDDTASMEQLEQDLKSILSEISQLGQTSNNERETSWQNKKSAAAAAAGASHPIMTPSVRLSSAGPTIVSTCVTPKAAIVPVMTVEQAKEKEPEAKRVPKFCHSCGASYPERHTVKFCCQCGARRLYV